jgi:opacity protein-like surface antigen
VNSMNSQTYLDSMTSESLGFNIFTGEISKAFKSGIEINGEMGMGRYFSPNHSGKWGEAINLKFNFTKKAVKIPTEIHVFRISDKVINNNAIFFNSSIVEANNAIPAGSVGSSAALVPFASALTPIGQFTNNRQGININSEYELKKFKFSVANGISTEIEGLSNQISYGHPVNQLTRSRLWRWNFPTGVGPYNRYNVIFRDVYELVQVTDSAVAKKFNVIEFQTKYSTKVANRNLYVFWLSRLSSVQDFLSPITVFSEKAYLRHYSHELEMYYSINPKTVITSYLGYESVVANYSTEVDAISKRPRDQRGWGLGLGVDYDIAKNTALYIRHRWFNFEDKSFSRDAFAGKETVIELKFSF